MRILLDFELYGNPDMDNHIADIILALKQELFITLKYYQDRIDQEKIIPFIKMVPGEFNVGFINSSEEFEKELQSHINKNFDFETAIKKIIAKSSN